jgi:hypothetical protein
MAGDHTISHGRNPHVAAPASSVRQSLGDYSLALAGAASFNLKFPVSQRVEKNKFGNGRIMEVIAEFW